MYILGIDPTQVWDPAATEDEDKIPQFADGQQGIDDQGNVYRFTQMDSGGATGDGTAVVVKGPGNSDMLNTTTSAPGVAQGMPVGFARAAIPASGWGWLQVCGVGNVLVSASCARGTQLNTTAADGRLDDDATAGAEVVNGVALVVANGGSNGVVQGMIHYPTVGRTL